MLYCNHDLKLKPFVLNYIMQDTTMKQTVDKARNLIIQHAFRMAPDQMSKTEAMNLVETSLKLKTRQIKVFETRIMYHMCESDSTIKSVNANVELVKFGLLKSKHSHGALLDCAHLSETCRLLRRLQIDFVSEQVSFKMLSDYETTIQNWCKEYDDEKYTANINKNINLNKTEDVCFISPNDLFRLVQNHKNWCDYLDVESRVQSWIMIGYKIGCGAIDKPSKRHYYDTVEIIDDDTPSLNFKKCKSCVNHSKK